MKTDNTSHRPTIVCLCGSTKFRKAYEEAQLRETLAGKIVLSIGGFPRHSRRVWNLVYGPNGSKAALDELHLRKIDLADEVLVLNIGGYVGESTKREIAYATRTGKPIRFLE